MRYLPLHFDLKGRPVLVVGGGEIATRKVRLLLTAGAQLSVIAETVNPDLKALLNGHDVSESRFAGIPESSFALVVAATDNEDLNALVSSEAKARSIPVNVVDSPELSTVVFPAIIDRDPVVVSVGSAGTSPVLTRRLRETIEQILPESLGRLGRFLGDRRARMKEVFTDVEERRRQTEKFLDSAGRLRVEQGDLNIADTMLFQHDDDLTLGEVYLVGAGPGDPDLLTLKALQLLQRADVVLYDNLVSPKILDRARRDASREFVGKRSGYKSTSQEDINDLLVRLAREGHRVLRLKGGDPFIFGRGGEEITALIANEIPFQVVPGITAASGCAAYAGIPLTHRELSQSVKFVTGHPKDGEVDLPWHEMTHENETLVFYMGLGGLSSICRQLVSHGRRPETPVALVSKGTTPDQQVLKADLETMPGLAARAQIQSPTLIIVGDVISFAD